MQLTEVIHDNTKESYTFFSECSTFLEYSRGAPLLKNLPCHYNDIHKVKLRMRKKKNNDQFTQTFNEAFNEIPHLRQRAMFTNGLSSFIPESDEKEPFYIFPINGFKFMYSHEVTNSSTDYRSAFETILEQCHDDYELIEQVIKYTYTEDNLYEGIKRGSEIILFNIPYCYAVRCKNNDYSDLMQTVIGK